MKICDLITADSGKTPSKADMKITKNWQEFSTVELKYETAKGTEQLSSSQVAYTVF